MGEIMTKLECEKCEKLMIRAIISAKEAEILYNFLDENETQKRDTEYEIAQRRADQTYGQALGMNQVLSEIGFKHDKMKKLAELIY